jgi:hypothetical protein
MGMKITVIISALMAMTPVAVLANLGDTWKQAAARYEGKAEMRTGPQGNMYSISKKWLIDESFNPKTGLSYCITYSRFKLDGPLDQATIADLQKQNLPGVSGWTEISPGYRPSDDDIDYLQVSADGSYMIARSGKANSVTFATAEGMLSYMKVCQLAKKALDALKGSGPKTH